MLPKRVYLTALLFFVVLAVGCTGQVRVASIDDAIGGEASVTGRHDIYMNADAGLVQTERDVYLAQSARVVAAVAEAQASGSETVNASELAPDIAEIVARHNQYIATDGGLSDNAKGIFTLEATILNRLFQEAARNGSVTGAGGSSPLSQ